MDSSNYELYDTVDVDNLCDYLYSSDSPLNEKLKEIGAYSGTVAINCALIGLAGAVASGGTLSVVSGAATLLCGGSVVGCNAAKIIKDTAGCSSVEVDIYIADEIESSPLPVILVPRCIDGSLAATAAELAEAAANYGEEVAIDIADDLADTLGDIAETGDDIIFGN